MAIGPEKISEVVLKNLEAKLGEIVQLLPKEERLPKPIEGV